MLILVKGIIGYTYLKVDLRLKPIMKSVNKIQSLYIKFKNK